MFHKRRIVIVLCIFLLIIFTLITQVVIGFNSKAEENTAQDDLRVITRKWIAENNIPLLPEKVRSPIGMTSLGCRYLTLDFFRKNCYGMIIYVEESPPESVIAAMRRILPLPCSENVKVLLSSEERLRKNFGCGADRVREFRLVISFQKITSRIHESGHVINYFDEINKIIVKGRN